MLCYPLLFRGRGLPWNFLCITRLQNPCEFWTMYNFLFWSLSISLERRKGLHHLSFFVIWCCLFIDLFIKHLWHVWHFTGKQYWQVLLYCRLSTPLCLFHTGLQCCSTIKYWPSWDIASGNHNGFRSLQVQVYEQAAKEGRLICFCTLRGQHWKKPQRLSASQV